jgi:outer membrane lipoprotein-sorting protein
LLKILIILLLITSSIAVPLFGQDEENINKTQGLVNITSVNDVKKLMSDSFSHIEDYTGDFLWVNGDARYSGKITYKKTNKILLKFDEPKDQEIVSNGQYLYIYIPSLKVVVQQSLSENTESNLLTSTTEAGLTRLFDEYSFSFYDSSSLQPFHGQQAYHMKLAQKRPKVGFSTMDIWVSKEGLILQSNGISPNSVSVSLTFLNIQTNTEQPDYIFDFEIPPDAQIIRNILVPFSDTQE